MAEKLKVQLTLDDRGVITKMKVLGKTGEQSFNKINKKAGIFNKTLGSLKGGVSAFITAFAFKKIVDGFVDVIKVSSETEESLNKVKEVFGPAAQSIITFADNAAESLGASRREALAMTGEIGNLLRSMGFTAEETADMSANVVQLAADIGSFNNAPTVEVLNAIRSALIGSSEPMLKFGADTRQTKLDQFALSQGMEFTKGKMDSQTKALASLKVIFRDTELAQGDFQRTSDSLANSTKTLGAKFDDLKGKLGDMFKPIAEGAVDTLLSLFSSDTNTQVTTMSGTMSLIAKDMETIAKNAKKTREELDKAREKQIDLADGSKLTNDELFFMNQNVEETTDSIDEFQKNFNKSFDEFLKSTGLSTDELLKFKTAFIDATSTVIDGEDAVAAGMRSEGNVLDDIIKKRKEDGETLLVNALGVRSISDDRLHTALKFVDVQKTISDAFLRQNLILEEQRNKLSQATNIAGFLANQFQSGFQNARNFGQAVENIFLNVVKILAQRAAINLFALALSSLVPGGGFLSTILGFKHGGIVPNINPLGLRGSDTVPALLSPGEMVLTQQQAQTFNINQAPLNINIRNSTAGNVNRVVTDNRKQLLSDLQHLEDTGQITTTIRRR